MISFSLDTSAWSRQARRLIAATGQSAAEVLKSEGKLFLLDCVKLTPPTGKHPFSESLNAQRRAGERAIEKDLRKIFHNPLELGIVKKNPQLASALQKYISGSSPNPRTAAGKAARKLLGKRPSAPSAQEAAVTLLRRIGVKEPIIPEATAQLHQSARGAGGRTLRSPHWMVLNPRSIDKLIKQKQKLVGLEKSGWNAAAAGLGLKLPAWIRNKSAPGLWKDATRIPDQPSITIGNLLGYAQSHGAALQVVKRALDRRLASLKHRLEHILGSHLRNP